MVEWDRAGGGGTSEKGRELEGTVRTSCPDGLLQTLEHLLVS